LVLLDCLLDRKPKRLDVDAVSVRPKFVFAIHQQSP